LTVELKSERIVKEKSYFICFTDFNDLIGNIVKGSVALPSERRIVREYRKRGEEARLERRGAKKRDEKRKGRRGSKT